MGWPTYVYDKTNLYLVPESSKVGPHHFDVKNSKLYFLRRGHKCLGAGTVLRYPLLRLVLDHVGALERVLAYYKVVQKVTTGQFFASNFVKS